MFQGISRKLWSDKKNTTHNYWLTQEKLCWQPGLSNASVSMVKITQDIRRYNLMGPCPNSPPLIPTFHTPNCLLLFDFWTNMRLPTLLITLKTRFCYESYLQFAVKFVFETFLNALSILSVISIGYCKALRLSTVGENLNHSLIITAYTCHPIKFLELGQIHNGYIMLSMPNLVTYLNQTPTLRVSCPHILVWIQDKPAQM